MASRMSKTAKKAKQYDHVLILMRHAKAEVTGKNGDYDRPLAEKGLKQAKKVAKGLREMKLVPEVIDCSAALRARQTCGRLLKVFGDKTQVDYHQSLYDGGLQAVFDELAHAKDKTRVMMVLGHEPTVSMACQWLAGKRSDPGMLDLLNLGMSTACVAVFGSEAPLRKWGVHEAELIAVLSPKDFD